MQWFRHYHGTSEDPKFRLIARKTGIHLCSILAYWHYVLEYSSDQDDRGSVEGFDLELAAITLDLDDAESKIIFENFYSSKLLKNDRVKSWEDRQFESDLSTYRVRKYREKKMKNDGNQPKKTDETFHQRFGNGHVTPQNRTEQNRAEQSKESKKDVISNDITQKKERRQLDLCDLSVEHIQTWLTKKRSQGKFTKYDEYEILEYFKNYCENKNLQRKKNGNKTEIYQDYIKAFQNSFSWDNWGKKYDKSSSKKSKYGFEVKV